VQIPVYVLGLHVALISFVINVLEQLLTGKVLTVFDDLRQSWMVDIDTVNLAALAFELKSNLPAIHFGVAVEHGGQSVGVVGSGVFFVANANKADLEQLNHSREHLVPG
jgi:hypothetical protein